MSVHLFFGEEFNLADEVSEWALMEFAESAEAAEHETLAAAAAIMRLLKEVVAPEDWVRFRSVARKNKAGVDDCLPLVVAVWEGKTVRPTERPADSSDGPSSTEPRSMSDSAARAIDLLPGRPDLQRLVLLTQEAKSA